MILVPASVVFKGTLFMSLRHNDTLMVCVRQFHKFIIDESSESIFEIGLIFKKNRNIRFIIYIFLR